MTSFYSQGSGKTIHRLRGSDQDVISLSWCPVPYNVITYNRKVDMKPGGDENETEERDLLLATSGMDKSIFIWRTGSDGRYQVVLNVPIHNVQRRKGYVGNASMMWIAVHWVDAYTLLSTSQNGELLSWDFTKVAQNKKLQPQILHSRHTRSCFTIACPVVYDVVRDEKRTVWTTAMDKHIVAYSLSSGNIVVDIPTMGGTVYAMAISSLDPNRLAISSSDGKVFIWNTSDLSSLDITTHFKKIIGKVMAVCWHPIEEDWLAYGTSDGHIGLIDVSSNKFPTLFRLHHRNSIYRLCWAPPILNSGTKVIEKKMVLYSLGDGDVYQYIADPQVPNEEPKSLNIAVLNGIDLSLGLQKSLIRSDITFKPDYTCFTVGNENGSLYIVSCETLKLLHVLYPHKKLMNNLEWHPATVSSDNKVSAYKDWLATTCDDIIVYNIPSEGQPELVAKLIGHSAKIVGLAWSPHYNGRLLSSSYDHTVMVWDVSCQSCLGVYLNHNSSVMCALFSPQNPEIIISGAADNTVQFWTISELSNPSKKPTKKKDHCGNTLKQRAGVEEATELTVGISELSANEEPASKTKTQNGSTTTSPTNSLSGNATVSDKGAQEYKKRQVNRAVFTVTSSKLSMANHFEVLYQRWAAESSPSTPSLIPSVCEDMPSVEDLGYLDFFGDDKAMQRLLMVEESQLKTRSNQILAQTAALWRGDVSEMIRDAVAKKKINDWLMSIAPLAGFEVWEEACAAYVNQLIESGEVFKASSYLLATHNVHEAISLLLEYKLYKEAAAIAKCRLSANDPLLTEVYTQWGNSSKQQGSLSLAAHCYLAANNLHSCIETLGRCKDLKSLKLAAMLARHLGNQDLAASIAVECLTMCVAVGNFTVARNLVTEMPQYQHFNVWLKASELLMKVKNRSEVEVFDWLEGRRPGLLHLFDELTIVCSCDGEVYTKLLPHLPTNKTPEFERDMWCYVSGQLAAACAAQLEATPLQFLRHTVSALSAAFHFQTVHPESLASLLTLTLLAPAGLFAKGSIFTVHYESSKEKKLMRSLKAFVCASLVDWMTNNWEKVMNLGSSKHEKALFESGGGDCVQICHEYKMDWLPGLLTSCSADVLDAENVNFFIKKAQKEELQNIATKEIITKKCVEKKVETTFESSITEATNKDNVAQNKTENVVEKNIQEKKENKTYSEGKITNINLKRKETEVVDENVNYATEKKDSSESNIKSKILKDLNETLECSVAVVNGKNKETLDEGTEEATYPKSQSLTNNYSKALSVTEDTSYKLNSFDTGSSKSNSEFFNVSSEITKLDAKDSSVKNKEDKVESLISVGKSENSTEDKVELLKSDPVSVEQSAKSSEGKVELPKSLSKSVEKNEKSFEEKVESLKSVERSEKSFEDIVELQKSVAVSIANSEKPEKILNTDNEDARVSNDYDSNELRVMKTKSEEIKELEKVLQQFQTERVSVPSPFQAYMNMRQIIEKVVKNKDSKLAQRLQEDCDRLWKKSQ